MKGLPPTASPAQLKAYNDAANAYYKVFNAKMKELLPPSYVPTAEELAAQKARMDAQQKRIDWALATGGNVRSALFDQS
jgi:hypothetical protein